MPEVQSEGSFWVSAFVQFARHQMQTVQPQKEGAAFSNALQAPTLHRWVLLPAAHGAFEMALRIRTRRPYDSVGSRAKAMRMAKCL